LLNRRANLRRRADDILGVLVGSPQDPAQIRPAIEQLLDAAMQDTAEEVRSAARTARRIIARRTLAPDTAPMEEGMLSIVERIIFLKEVPFFQAMTIDQLKVLAGVCEEQLLEKEQKVFNQGEPGGALYVVVSGRVAIEQERRKGSFARLATVGAHSYFGELGLFDDSPRTTSAITLQDTLVLRLRREPLIALMRQHPDLSLKLINVLNQRLREANDRIAELAPNRPRELHKFFDRFDTDG
jgi:CRP-like cAMP-binding protein